MFDHGYDSLFDKVPNTALADGHEDNAPSSSVGGDALKDACEWFSSHLTFNLSHSFDPVQGALTQRALLDDNGDNSEDHTDSMRLRTQDQRTESQTSSPRAAQLDLETVDAVRTQLEVISVLQTSKSLTSV